MAKLQTNYELTSDKSKNPVVSSEFVKHGNKWLDKAVDEAVTAVNAKADKTYVDSELAKKATTEAVATVDAKVNGKADANVVSQLQATVNTKADASTVAALSERVTANTTGITEANSRIDAIVALPEGSTTGDAELIDIRTKADGTKATSAGAAVREQVTDLKSDLNQISDKIFSDINIPFDDITQLNGGYFRSNATIGVGEANSVVGWYKCKPNTTYKFVRSGGDTNWGIAYVNEDKHIADVQLIDMKRTNVGTSLEVTTSANAVLVYIWYYTNTGHDYKLYEKKSKVEMLDEKLDESNSSYTLKIELESGALPDGKTSYTMDDHERENRCCYTIKTNGAKKVNIGLDSAKYSIIRVYFYDKDFKFLQKKEHAQASSVRLDDVQGTEYIRINFGHFQLPSIKDVELTFVGCSRNPECVKNPKMRTDTEWLTLDVNENMYTCARLMLPPNYSVDGEKSPLILFMDGSGNFTNWTSDFASIKMPFLRYLKDEGFAILSVFGWGSNMIKKYPQCGMAHPYPTPTNFACIKAGVEWVCDRYNIDYNNIHIMSKSQGGQCAVYFATHQDFPIKSIGMFAPVTDYLSMPMEGIYYQTRQAIAEDMNFTGEVDYFGSESFLTYSERGKAFFRENAEKVCGMNEAWAGLVGGTLQTRIEDSLNYCEKFWTEQYWTDESKTDIYTHHDRCKMGNVPVKIWGASDDDNTPYLSMIEIVKQLQNGGCEAHMRTLPRGTGGHSCADVDGNFVDSVTTKLGIVHTHIPIGWIENVEWIRSKMPK